METKTTYEHALEKASPRLRDKIRHSVELIRKSEALALKYDPEHGFVCATSFGKDSQAVYHLAQLAGVRFQGWFSPTTVDHAEVLRFGKKQYPEVKWTKPRKSIYQAAFDSHALPTRMMRFCCAEFKEDKFPNKVVLLGIRRGESAKRALRKEVEISGRKFSGTLDEFEQYQYEWLKKKYKNLNQDQFSEVKSDTSVRCIGGKDQIMVMPILDWTDADVWEFLNDVAEVPHCGLYDNGKHRIGCIMCPFSQKRQMIADAREHPRVYWRWVGVVRAIREHKDGLFADNRSLSPAPEKNVLYTQLRGGEKFGGLLNPFGQEITDPAEAMVHWWISKLSFKEWYAKHIAQRTLDFDETCNG